ncbi:MAG: hypothetical protein IKD89_08545 [Clostridia bacterium]|nr:hypothetical protein [Clostridia bacterium]
MDGPRILKYALCAVFLAALFGALIINIALPDKEFLENENRMAQTLPKFSADALLSGKWTAEFEEYSNDQFVFRDGFISLKSMSERALGRHENGGVFFGRDRLIEAFPPADEKLFSDNVNAVKAFADATEVPVYFALIPTAAHIYRGELPYGAPFADEETLISKAYAVFGGGADIAGALSAHRDEYIFYRTDHHWTSLGARYGCGALCDELGLDSAVLSGYKKDVLTEDFNGTLYSLSGARDITPDEIDAYVPSELITVERYDSAEPSAGGLYYYENLTVKDKYRVFLGGNSPRVVIKTRNYGAPALLVIRDSYCDSLAPFLTPYFSEIHLLDLRYYKSGVSEYIEDNDIDKVLVIYGLKKFSEDTNIRAFLK